MTTPSSEIDGFDELDALLIESKKLAAAKTAAKKSAKLTPEQEDLLEADAIAAMLAQWEDEEVFGHFITTTCNCGAETRRFNAWYVLSSHVVKENVYRLVKSDDHNNLPASRYETQERVAYCAECLEHNHLPEVDADDYTILGGLGCECSDVVAVEQMELDLQVTAEPLIDLLEELNDEID